MDFDFETTRGTEQFFSEDDLSTELQCMVYSMYQDEAFPCYFVTPITYFRGIFNFLQGDNARLWDFFPREKELCAMKACARFERAFREWEHINYDFKEKFTSFIDHASDKEIRCFMDTHAPDYDLAMTMGHYLAEGTPSEYESHFRCARLFWRKYPEYFFGLFRKNDLIANLFLMESLNYRKLKAFVQDALAYDPDYFKNWKDDFGNNVLHYFLIGAGVRRYRALGGIFLGESFCGNPEDVDYKEFVKNETFVREDFFGKDAEKIIKLLIQSGVNPDEPDMAGVTCRDLRKYSYMYYCDAGEKIQKKGEELLEIDRENEERASDDLEEDIVKHAESRSVRRSNKIKRARR